MGQIKLIITVDETEYARPREKAEAQQREPGAVVGELITQWLAEQPPHALDARSEGFEPFEAWQHNHRADFNRLLALPIDERRDLARPEQGKFLPPSTDE